MKVDLERHYITETELSNLLRLIRNFPNYKLKDRNAVLKLILDLGLNDEKLNEQSSQFASYFGKGLKIWQYPNQLSSLIVYLANFSPEKLSKISGYVEIGCRWGGTFIFMNEILLKLRNQAAAETGGSVLQFNSVCVDVIDEPLNLTIYKNLLKSNLKVNFTYFSQGSQSEDFLNHLKHLSHLFILIDGDHALKSVLLDHINVLDYADFILHHDIKSDAVPDVGILYSAISKLSSSDFDSCQFTEQYEDVVGNYLGIGLLSRKSF